jgi:hypothetical protein
VKTNGTWGSFSAPILWSHYGKDGKDGDGVQYIFTVTDGTVPANPTPDDYETNSEYQNGRNDEYVPQDPNNKFIWKDDPVTLTDKDPVCWMCIRRFRNGL